MNPRAFLVRGLLVGLLAGFAALLVAHQVGEPHVARAIALEEAGDAATADEGTHADGEHADEHSHDESTPEVSRSNQRTWGLLTGTLAVGIALGGILALVAAGALGRMGRLSPTQSTAVVAAVGFLAYALVPFLKYPATPPGVGSADTIGARTGEYFLFTLISVVAAVAVTVLATRVWPQIGALPAVVSAAGTYLLVVVVAGQVLPTVNEVGDFPADTLWYFRRASILTLAALWAVLGTGLAWAVGRLHERTSAVQARRELAASL